MFNMRQAGLGFLCTAALLGASACELSQNYLKADRSGDMEVQDYRDAMAPRLPTPEEAEPAAGANIPDLKPYIADPAKASVPMPLVSVTVNQDVPLRDVLYEIANQADYDIELDPRIQGSIIFTARNRPLDVVVERISEIAGLRYEFEDERLRVELDTPYHQNYKINYLSYIRRNQSSISNDVAVVSGEGADTGSSFEAAAESEADFWGELESNLTQILQADMGASTLRTQIDPVVLAAGEIPPLIEEGAAPSDSESVAVMPSEGRFSVNRQGGLVSIFATKRKQDQVKNYLDLLRRSVTSQVLIEAKVLEVSLSDEFSAGIDWSTVNLFGGEGLLEFDAGGGFVRGILDAGVGPASNFRLTQTGNDFTAAIDAISRFGTVKALASPRLTVLNNQSAVLNVAENRVYFEIDIDQTTSTEGVTTTQIDSQIRNVPEGVLINVQPSIDLEGREISMAVRPTVTRITDSIPDPAVAFASADLDTPISSPVPVVNVQEFDSVLQMNDGQAIVMGGLIQDRMTSTQNTVPVLGEIPLMGALFRNQQDNIEKTELVVLMRAKIVEGGNNVHNTDKDIYRTFSGDRRPFKL